MTEEIKIDALAYGGDGVGRMSDGRAVFVPGTCPGDVVLVDIRQRRDRFARGRIEQILQASEYRVEPACDEPTLRGGGAPWAHIDYQAQLHWKRQAVVDALTRIGHMDAQAVEQLVAPCVPSKKLWNYRNKVEFEVGQDVAGRFTLGMHVAGGGFEPMASCSLAPKKVAHAPKALTGALRYAAGKADLGIERVGVRCSERTGDVEVALWTSPGKFPRANVARIIPDAMGIKNCSVTRVLVKGDTKERKVSGVESLAGRGNWRENVRGRTMLLSAPSFFQVNTAGAEKLIDLVMEGLDPSGIDTVMDLYSGAGTFTLPLAEAAMNVIAVEMAGSSVRDLRRNLEKNELWADVIGGDVARELQNLGYIDSAVVDPPRSGLGQKAIEGLMGTRAHRIAYVSCNPTTLARDLQAMTANDAYRIESVTPVDLFPQTFHVETVVLMSRVKD